jgi:uncharacterized protein
MNDPKRPLPNPAEYDTRDFWAATKNRELKYQQCKACQTIVFYPRRHCTGCTDGELVWKTASGDGTVYTYSVVRQSYHPFFRNRIPYTVAWIDLDEGPRLLSNIVDVDDVQQDIKIGMRVKVTWEEHESLCIPLFRPA